MTETTFKVRLSELASVRILCKRNGCGGIAEIPISQLRAVSAGITCPACRESFLGDTPAANLFSDLGRMLERIGGQAQFEIEFPICIGGQS